jgi:hypothetical protein
MRPRVCERSLGSLTLQRHCAALFVLLKVAVPLDGIPARFMKPAE